MGIISLLTQEQKENLYLDYVNNFLTVDRFAEYYMIDIDLAECFLNNMRAIRNAN
tara:strand:- start:156 stop:320 length:165 start_codon:yes stop_codon:yes gene_type:complete